MRFRSENFEFNLRLRLSDDLLWNLVGYNSRLFVFIFVNSVKKSERLEHKPVRATCMRRTSYLKWNYQPTVLLITEQNLDSSGFKFKSTSIRSKRHLSLISWNQLGWVKTCKFPCSFQLCNNDDLLRRAGVHFVAPNNEWNHTMTDFSPANLLRASLSGTTW